MKTYINFDYPEFMSYVLRMFISSILSWASKNGKEKEGTHRKMCSLHQSCFSNCSVKQNSWKKVRVKAPQQVIDWQRRLQQGPAQTAFYFSCILIASFQLLSRRHIYGDLTS